MKAILLAVTVLAFFTLYMNYQSSEQVLNIIITSFSDRNWYLWIMILMLQVKTTMITAPNYAHPREESTVEVLERVKYKF